MGLKKLITIGGIEEIIVGSHWLQWQAVFDFRGIVQLIPKIPHLFVTHGVIYGDILVQTGIRRPLQVAESGIIGGDDPQLFGTNAGKEDVLQVEERSSQGRLQERGHNVARKDIGASYHIEGIFSPAEQVRRGVPFAPRDANGRRSANEATENERLRRWRVKEGFLQFRNIQENIVINFDYELCGWAKVFHVLQNKYGFQCQVEVTVNEILN